MTAYYNEFDPFAAAWLRELIAAGLIPAGDVDERSIEDVTPNDLKSYVQCHFFAGIGGWAYALRLAGWPDDRPVWTGSCPCQPFSAAGRRNGADDERHLWPAWFWLISRSRPAVVFGEQVDSVDGRVWLATVQADLEAAGYAVGRAALPAAGVGAPHIRSRLWFVADADQERRLPAVPVAGASSRLHLEAIAKNARNGGRMAHPQRHDGRADEPGRGEERRAANGGIGGGMGDADSERRAKFMPSPISNKSQLISGRRDAFWSDVTWLPCADGKARPIEPGIEPLADGVSARVGRLRGYGNAIVPQVAARFIAAYEEATA